MARISASLFTASAQAQTITPLVQAGDAFPNGLGDKIHDGDVNDSGDWLVEIVWDLQHRIESVLRGEGVLLHRESPLLSFPVNGPVTILVDRLAL